MDNSDNNCKGRCAIHYKDMSYQKTKTNFIRIDGVIFNWAYLGFKKCTHCLFVAITETWRCSCCGYRLKTKRSGTNTNNYEPYEEERQIYGYSYHMMPGFAEMRQQWYDEAEDKTPYIARRKRTCKDCGATESRIDQFGVEQWFSGSRGKNRIEYICSACYYKRLYYEKDRKVYHKKLRYLKKTKQARIYLETLQKELLITNEIRQQS